MRLTAYTDYALRVLIYLAVSPEEKITIRGIAEHYGISRNHLMKVVQDLSQRGYVVALRGKNGGLSLNISTAEIRIGDLVEAMEKDMALTECLGDNNQCILTPACGLKCILDEGLRAFLDTLNRYTLEDVVAGPRKAELIKTLDLQ
ncbi:RrF2 family transcriptional regulator [Pseudohalioglobus lutimaris]|uniref:Rrf2 family transcriptional regulator n=1 Tax=Pseudohalioglobus lutimaris TaxID=1737061 RepID=A0A2N5X296_9GAMM|nr:Rrf2 family transcriptional regulator [Pseudohalioglobus lutimaris]PLW68609.1 Rrf2 family transcriptional regulator [Pseudohalioglobus lutimaris]